MEVSLLLYVPDVALSPGPSESTISGPWHSFDPRPSPDFSPQLQDKIWEGPGDEAIPDVQAPVTTLPFWCPSLQVCYPSHSVMNTQRSNFHSSSLLSNRFRGKILTWTVTHCKCWLRDTDLGLEFDCKCWLRDTDLGLEFDWRNTFRCTMHSWCFTYRTECTYSQVEPSDLCLSKGHRGGQLAVGIYQVESIDVYTCFYTGNRKSSL